ALRVAGPPTRAHAGLVGRDDPVPGAGQRPDGSDRGAPAGVGHQDRAGTVPDSRAGHRRACHRLPRPEVLVASSVTTRSTVRYTSSSGAEASTRTNSRQYGSTAR